MVMAARGLALANLIVTAWDKLASFLFCDCERREGEEGGRGEGGRVGVEGGRDEARGREGGMVKDSCF